MPNRSVANCEQQRQSIKPQVLTASTDVTGAAIDLQPCNAATIVISVGDKPAGLTFAAAKKVDFILEKSETTGADASWTAVEGQYNLTRLAEDASGNVGDDGKLLTLDADAKAGKVYWFGFTGPERYIRVRADVTGDLGATGIGVSVGVTLGLLRHERDFETTN